MSKLYEMMAPTSQINLPALLGNLKKACGLWFLTERSSVDQLSDVPAFTSSFDHIASTTVEIVRHGLRLSIEASLTKTAESSQQQNNSTTEELKKIMEDFEWVRRAAHIRCISGASSCSAASQSPRSSAQLGSPQEVFEKWLSIDSFLYNWVLHNLRANCLCACLELLVEEKELLHAHYVDYAFLRNEAFSTALFICLRAIELNQYSLLSRIEAALYNPPPLAATKHRRANSHPIFSISPPKNSRLGLKHESKTLNEDMPKQHNERVQPKSASISTPKRQSLATFRRVKSLPTVHKAFLLTSCAEKRPRCKTMFTNATKYYSSNRATSPSYYTSQAFSPPSDSLSITKISYDLTNNENDTNSFINSTPRENAEFMRPSTSRRNEQSQLLNFTQPLHSSTSSTCGSSCSSYNTTPAFQIDIINCDDIKIWTDQAYEMKQAVQEKPTATEPFNIPQQSEQQKQKTKSVSPLGSFLCNLFSTPPTYTRWSLPNQHAGANIDTSNTSSTTFPCNALHSDHTSTVGVFESFLPVCGKKLRSRNSQNLFEDGISSLDYSATPTVPAEATETASEMAAKSTTLPKSQQTLADFLQNSQMSRNNTDLEKENAHFRISEAIISAIEHMKWSNAEPEKKWRRRKENVTTATATDWLAAEQQQHSRRESIADSKSSFHGNTSEHISYAELGESCLDLLSAEVVGLSLISKFNDKHLPKVSELKWLVSEEDTPQQLLPMPDDSPTANPDENVVRSMTRGTRYWAPPRQQIIFTDHPTPNRKQLIRKQNNRCAGCGMRVSQQYMNSFRYCTYLGKYHCTGCHRNQISPIPAKILQSWDFKCYPVSVFAYRLLEQMYTFPLFYVPDLNPALYVNNKPLLIARKKRIQLKFVKDFVKTCRFGIREQVYFDGIPDHITGDPDIWSLSDFVDVHNKSMARSIDHLIEKCENHIFNCVLCTARGFHCEYCQKDQVIYPWQQKVFRCDRCGACFHLSCWKLMSETCCRCQRIDNRQEEMLSV